MGDQICCLPPSPCSRLFPPSIKQSIGGLRLRHFQNFCFSFFLSFLSCQLNNAVCRSGAKVGQGVLWPGVGGREDALAPGSPGEQGRGHFRAIFNVLKDVPAAKAALKHFTSFEFVVWCNILRDTLTELAFAELIGQKSDSTFGDVDWVWRHARRVATNVKEKRYCRTTLQDMGTVLVCKDKGGGPLAKPPPSPLKTPTPLPPPLLKRSPGPRGGAGGTGTVTVVFKGGLFGLRSPLIREASLPANPNRNPIVGCRGHLERSTRAACSAAICLSPVRPDQGFVGYGGNIVAH